MGKSAIIFGLTLFGIGIFITIKFNGSLSNIFIYYAGFFLAIIGGLILAAHFKGWLERTSGTRF